MKSNKRIPLSTEFPEFKLDDLPARSLALGWQLDFPSITKKCSTEMWRSARAAILSQAAIASLSFIVKEPNRAQNSMPISSQSDALRIKLS
jgi:hypothetical protein